MNTPIIICLGDTQEFKFLGKFIPRIGETIFREGRGEKVGERIVGSITYKVIDVEYITTVDGKLIEIDVTVLQYPEDS